MLLAAIVFISLPTITAQAGQVGLAWTASTGPVGGYRIYFGRSSGNYTVSLDVGTRTAYAVTGLLDGGTYYFAVKAYDITRTIESGFSNEVSKSLAEHTVGLYNPTAATFYLRNLHRSGMADVTFRYGPADAGWLPLAGDWDGDGIHTVGLYDPTTSTFYLRGSNDGGEPDITFRYGPAGVGWLPLAGDWDGNGIHTVGLYNSTTSTFYLRNLHRSGMADVTFRYGPADAGWLPLAGDWDGPGR